MLRKEAHTFLSFMKTPIGKGDDRMEKYLMLDRRLLSPQGMANLKLEVSQPVKV